MKPIQTILYATDFSDSSLPACEYAVYLAQLAGARLQVLHVIGEFADKRKSRIQPETLALLEREVEIQAFKSMEEFCHDHIGTTVACDSEVVMGLPFQEILKQAEAIDADLIVIGSHGRTGLEHVLVGSTAERLVRRSVRPVLTIRSRGV
ncbi:MAG: universal stress protein [Desulfuromonas sp.]|uniref:universal stress protein n=1 Tax=Desulfuromonas thiophila TaxID=57664 RepID=UPI0024A8832A|nr:universal stress protein [Desulfuromonas thiophila]